MSTMTTEPITNDADVLDSRDVIARIAQLVNLRQPGPVPGPVLFTVYLFSCRCGQVPPADAAHGSAASLEATIRQHAGHAHSVRRVVTPNPIPARLPHVQAAFQEI